MVQVTETSEKIGLNWDDATELFRNSSVDEVGLKERVSSLATRSIKKES